jgi:hypothetical protein
MLAQGPRGPGAAGGDTAQFNPAVALFGQQVVEFAEQAGFGGGGGAGGGAGLAALAQSLMGGPSRPPGDTVLVVVTDVRGDTVRTLYTNARPTPLRWLTWDMRRARAPLSPVARRDSVRAATRIAFLRDSLRAAMPDTAGGRQARPGGLAALVRDPERGEPGQWQGPLRAALNPPSAGLNRDNPIEQGFGGGGGAFGPLGGRLVGGAGGFVEPGTYLVTIRLNGREYKQPIRVERASQTSALSGGWQ